MNVQTSSKAEILVVGHRCENIAARRNCATRCRKATAGLGLHLWFASSLLRDRHARCVAIIRALRRDRQGVDDLEVQQRLRRQLDLLALLSGRNASASSGARWSADRRTFAAASKATDNGAQS